MERYDQAAGLILCAAGVARALRVPEPRSVFPLAVAESNQHAARSPSARSGRAPVPASRSPGSDSRSARGCRAPAAAERARSVQLLPTAVRSASAASWASDHRRTLTVTGGMAFAAPTSSTISSCKRWCARPSVLRSQPGAEPRRVTAVSGMVTKQGLSLWASRAPQRPFTYDDVAAEVAAATETVQVVGDRHGHGPGGGVRGLARARYATARRGARPTSADGTRTLATTERRAAGGCVARQDE